MSRFTDFLAGYEPGELEEVRRVQTVGKDFSDLMRKYERLLDIDNLVVGSSVYNIQDITEVLTPDEINHFLQGTQQYNDHRNYPWRTGIMVSRLIQNSYDHGYNPFWFNTENLSEIDCLGSLIVGKRETPISVTIQGNLGYCLGFKTQYSIFTINSGGVKSCGLEALNSTFILNGSTGVRLGFGAKHCTFKTSVWGNIIKLKESIYTEDGNTLIYIDNGKEVVIK